MPLPITVKLNPNFIAVVYFSRQFLFSKNSKRYSNPEKLEIFIESKPVSKQQVFPTGNVHAVIV